MNREGRKNTTCVIRDSMEEIAINVLQWNDYEIDNHNRIVATGRDRNGNKAAFIVDDYPIRVYMQLDKADGFKWNDKVGTSAISSLFNKKLGSKDNQRSLSDGWDSKGAAGPRVVAKHGVKDVLRAKDYFVECYYRSQSAVREAKNLLELKTCSIAIGKNTYRLQMAHDLIEPIKKLTVEAKLPWTGWILCSGHIKQQPDPTTTTTQSLEIHCSWKNIKYDATITDEVRESILFFDIECLGIQLQFPNKFNPKCPITQISYIARDPNTKQEIHYCLVYGDAKPRIIEGQQTPIIYNVADEKELLRKGLQIITDTDCDVISGYNTLGFDLDYFYHRCVLMGIDLGNSVSRIKDMPCKYYDKSWSSSNSNKVDVKYIEMPGRIHLDVYKIAKSTLKLANYKLNTVAEDRGVGSKVDVTVGEMFEAFRDHQRFRTALGKCTNHYDEDGEPVPHLTVDSAAWKRLLTDYLQSALRLQEIIHYCMVDTELSKRLYDKLKYMQTAREFANSFQVRISEVFTKGQGVKGLSLLFTMLCEEGVVLNKYDYELSEDGFEGALNLGTKYQRQGVFRKVASLDVQSMYPSQMRRHNISVDTELTEEEAHGAFAGRCVHHTWFDYEGTDKQKAYSTWLVDSTVRRGWFPRLLDDLIARRSVAKKLMNAHIGKPEYDTYEARQLALKIVANSIYGLIGSSYSKTPCKQLASLVTALSRKSLMNIVDFLHRGDPPAKWLEERNADVSKPRYPSTFAAATIVYGDTDSVQFYYPDIAWPDRPTMVRFYITLTKAINEYLHPIVVELEKIGDLHLEGPKHYAMRLLDQTPELSPGVPNPNFGKWKDNIKFTGIDTVKRNQSKFHRECLERIIKRILDDKSYYENMYPSSEEREMVTLSDNVDDLVTTLYKVYMELYPQADYEIYEAYSKEGVVSTMGTLARRQADNGRPIKVGERIGYVLVRFLKENDNTKVGEKARIVGEFDSGDAIDTLYYVNRMMTPYDTTMITRYRGDPLFVDFWKTRAQELNKSLGIKMLRDNPDQDPDKLFCDVLRVKLQGTKYASYPIPTTYGELMTMRESNDYATRFPQAMRTQVTKHINAALVEGWSLVLSMPNIVEKFVTAIRRNCVDEFIRAILSPDAYAKLKSAV